MEIFKNSIPGIFIACYMTIFIHYFYTYYFIQDMEMNDMLIAFKRFNLKGDKAMLFINYDAI